ncbi:MAG: multifunctional CCA tRNA nucleotidyl transferase/2'3'-cyclic phosphodiesterase/2'nucleotidase/phosphatase [Gammaproteobacteria bacterium]
MKIYLVGGAVRDQLLGRPIQERDWVVVGATPADMLALGYRPVGKDFPVFLHPQTHEEYALARTERKVGLGYKGFTFYTSPEVGLEEDLARRDLTINAMAQSLGGELIDPYQGQADLKQRLLHHVSPAFIEDPVRILRVARFAAKFGDFTVHPDTLALMQQMVKLGEVQALVAERVWQEWRKALAEPYPERFFEVLAACEALPILFPELISKMDVPALQRAVQQMPDTVIRLAVMCHALSKTALSDLSARYRLPYEYADMAILVVEHYSTYQKIETLSAEDIVGFLEKLDAFRRAERFRQFLLASQIIENVPTSSQKSQMLEEIQGLTQGVDPQPLLQQGLKGPEIGRALHEQRVDIVREFLRELNF